MSKIVDSNSWWEIKRNPVSRVGVFPYMGRSISDECEPDKVYYVYRPATTLEQSVDTWDNPPKPFINDHEMLGEGFSKIDDRPVQGVIHNPHFEDGVLYADLSVYSESLKDKIANGKKELSLGYFCKYRKEKGVYKGQAYDFVQEDMVGNHIALVDNGRCGSDVKVFDSKCTMDSFAIDTSQLVADDKDFVESEHPRDEGGKFTDAGGGATSAGFETAKETKKAVLLKKDGKTFWVQKRWLKDDGSLTPAGQRAFEDAPTDVEVERQKEERRLHWKEGVKIPTPDFESEKAYGFDLVLDFYNLEANIRERVFIPKSVIQDNGNIPNWLMNTKLAELEEKHKNKGGFIIEKSPFENGALRKANWWARKEDAGALDTSIADLKKNQDSAIIKNDEEETTTERKDSDMVDKREYIRKIMAIAAKPADDFDGGEEEKVETIAKLLENSEYAKSEDEAEEEEKKAEDKCGKDEESDKEEKETEDEEVSPADVMAFLKMILEEVRSLNGKKTTDEEEKAEDEEEAEKKSEDEDDDKKESEDEDKEEKKAEDSSDVIIAFAKDNREAPKSFMDDPALRKYLNI